MSSISFKKNTSPTTEPLSEDMRGVPTTIVAPRGDDPLQARDDEVFNQEKSRRLSLEDVRDRLAGQESDAFWQSLEELTEDPEFTELMEREFPRLSAGYTQMERRGFLKLMGASLAMAGMTACTRQPTERIVPYVRAPEEFVPGRATYFATSMPLAGYAVGVLAESHMGRPTKIEGNPDHPASLGSSNAIMQASILGLYDPDRSRSVKLNGVNSSWSAFQNALKGQLAAQSNTGGAGLRILTETVTSPSVASMIQEILERYPNAKWVQHDPVCRDSVRTGALMAFERHYDSLYDFKVANVVLSLDADFLGEGPAHVRYARDFSVRRNPAEPDVQMNRLYVVESAPSTTGSMADHRLPMRSSDIESFVRALAREFGLDAPGPELEGEASRWVQMVAKDLRSNGELSVIVPGDRQPPVVHAIVHAIHDVLKTFGRTVHMIEPVEARPENQSEAIKALASEMESGKVQALIVLDANPAYNAPADLHFAEKIESLPFVAHLGLYEDETAVLGQWHVPMAHYLEGWGDARSVDGSASIIQPLIEPLYDGRTIQEVLAVCLGQDDMSAYDLVKDFWTREGLGEGADESWRKSLHDGVISGSRFEFVRPKVLWNTFPEMEPTPSGLELVFLPDSATWDGRYANNAWLQEMPRALTKLTWDNVVLLSPATAEELGFSNGDVVRLTVREQTVEGPVWVQPGQARNSVGVQLGYGRRNVGEVGNGVGFDVYPLRSLESPWVLFDVTLLPTGARYPLATTQRHHQMHGIKDRHLVRVVSLEQFMANPAFAHEKGYQPADDESMYPLYDYSKGYQWGMTINLNTCIGCNACLVACQAENNIPVVGKREVLTGREMHWIRVDRYFSGDLDDPGIHMQPLTCMHCELAPCEPVCPVGATVHSADGLNQMVYNRCIGTRYCANNCPYKVRRFNFMQYVDEDSPQLKMLRNPNVTVRTRGVMEKCTYCIQRISKARIDAERDHRSIQDKDLQSACQQACPTRAIVFGDINNPDSEVSRMKASPLNYALLGELNVRPRTTYLAKVRNVNPESEGATSA